MLVCFQQIQLLLLSTTTTMDFFSPFHLTFNIYAKILS